MQHASSSTVDAAIPALHAPEVLDAENALLGILLSHPGVVPEAARLLTPWDFHGAEFDQSPNARIFEALIVDAEAGRRSEPYALSLRLSAALSELGGASYIGLLLANAPPAESAPEIVRQLATVAARRRIARAMADPTLTPETMAEVLANESQRTDDLTDRARVIRATPFAWREPRSIPTRQWLYDRHIIRRFVSTTVAPGGVGKTMLMIVEALAMVTGRPLLGVAPREPLRVWLLNLEDPREELERRIAAACLHYGIKASEVDGRLFVDSGRDVGLVIARSTRAGVEVCAPCIRQLEREIAARSIDVVIVDPFVACHEVSENDNGAINLVIKQWRELAERTNCGVELLHHTRKAVGGVGESETTVEDGRGASALLAGARSARALNPMKESQATEWGVDERRLYFSVTNGKANLARPGSQAKWRKLAEVDLENGAAGCSDLVGVPVAWEPPGVFEGVTVADLASVQKTVAAGSFKSSEQAADWVGHAVADVLGWSVDNRQDRGRIKALVRAWLSSGALKIERRTDPKRREEKPYIVVGEWVTA